MISKPIRQTLALFSVIALFIFGASCSKDDAPSKEELIARTWVINDLIASSAGENLSIYDDSYDACEQDDQYVFSADGKVTVNSGASKCDVAETNPIANGTWSFQDGGKKIALNASGIGSEVFDIDELTATSMKVSIVDNSTGFPIKLQFVMTSR